MPNALAEMRLPEDILLTISEQLDSKADIASLCQVSKSTRAAITSYLYADVTLRNADQCLVTLDMLRRSPDVASHIRRLVVTPKSRHGQRPGYYLGAAVARASTAVHALAMTKSMVTLSAFEWDGDELPTDDGMWLVLRLCCPQLRYVTTSVGALLPSVTSHLFYFRNLLGFAINPNVRYFESHGDRFSHDENPAIQRMWKMLIRDCPDLEQLQFGGPISPFPVDVHHLLGGRWPRLATLTLSNGVVDWDPIHAVRVDTENQKRPFIEFLECHPSLQNLTLAPRTIDVVHLSSISPEALPCLKQFSGTYAQLQALPSHFLSRLESVTFREELQPFQMYHLSTSGLLRSFEMLQTVRLPVMMDTMSVLVSLIKALGSSCPRLSRFEVCCANKTSFTLEGLARTFRNFTRLRDLEVILVQQPTDTMEALSSAAIELAKVNLRLETVRLTLLPPRELDAGEDALAVALSPPIYRTGEEPVIGRFTFMRDGHGLPVKFWALEKQGVSWPPFLGLRKYMQQRCYERDLRVPIVHVNDTLFGILAERSKAGEDLRMLTLCSVVLTVTVSAMALSW